MCLCVQCNECVMTSEGRAERAARKKREREKKDVTEPVTTENGCRDIVCNCRILVPARKQSQRTCVDTSGNEWVVRDTVEATCLPFLFSLDSQVWAALPATPVALLCRPRYLGLPPRTTARQQGKKWWQSCLCKRKKKSNMYVARKSWPAHSQCFR